MFPWEKRSEQKVVNYPPTKLNFVPKWSRQNVAFNFINKNFRAKRNMPMPIDQKYYNKRFSGNGARGKMNHDQEDMSKVTGYQKLVKEKTTKNININELALQQNRELNYNGAEVRGKRITLKGPAKDYIRQNNKKYNRGGKAGSRRSGAYSGGLKMRLFEKQQIKLSSADKMVEEKDEFSNLQNLIQEHVVPNNKYKTDTLGI